MRIRLLIVAMALVGLTACGSDTDDAAAGAAESQSADSAAGDGAFCDKFNAANTKEGEASRMGSDSPDFEESLKEVVEAYEDLSDIAPADIKPKIDDFIVDLKDAQASSEPVRLTDIWGDYMHDFADFITANCF